MATANSANGSGRAKLELTELEANLQRLLVDVAQHVNPAKPSELRYTGGWVRDKLLGVGSHDIDVAINDMTGYQFGLKMKEYLALPGKSEKYGIREDSTDDKTGISEVVRGLHKIEANPEKSKHLETVTTKIFGLDIDLVNLRKETYTEDSRTPQMEFGTAEEDALRRDATINAMFYNLQTREVEDFTGCGFQDMEKQIIRTPLEPYQTFKDDPLRVLRLIRFASRLDYKIHADAISAMKEPSIREALRAKISRERVGTELEKMLKGNDPHYALTMINDYGLYDTIFVDPTADHEFRPEVSKWFMAYNFVRDLIRLEDDDLRSILLPDKDHEYLAWVASCVVPWVDAPTPAPSKQSKKPSPVAVSVAREGFKAPNKVSDIINAAVTNKGDIENVMQDFNEIRQNPQKPKTAASRDTLGMAIRRWGSSWRLQIIFVMMCRLSAAGNCGTDTEAMLKQCRPFLTTLRKLDLVDAYTFKPLLDGKTLANALKMKPGPWMKDALEVVMAWQLRNPDNRSVDDAIAAVKDNHGELVSSLVRHFLELTIRPLFAKTRPPDITAQGHKSMTPVNPHARSHDLNEAFSGEKPAWKQDPHALGLLRWCVKHLTYARTETMWPLLIPPVMKLTDDSDTEYKAAGCQLLHDLFQAVSPALLKRTNLGQHFEDALTTAISFLPSLTPEAESIRLQNAGWPALLALAKLRYPDEPPSRGPHRVAGSSSGGDKKALTPTSSSLVQEVSEISPMQPDTASENCHNKAYYDNLRTLLHKHLLPSITHVLDTNPDLLIILLRQLSVMIKEMGTFVITQLKDLIPLLVGIQTNEFVITASPQLMRESLKVTAALIAQAWPRIPYWRGELFRGICAAWLDAHDQLSEISGISNTVADEGRSSTEYELIEQESRRCAKSLILASQQATSEDDMEIDINGDIGLLVDAEPQLEGLFDQLESNAEGLGAVA